MTATKQQIIAEADRRAREGGYMEKTEYLIIDVVREGWTPPEPVDPDLAAFREWESAQWPAYTCTQAAFLAGARMAREREQERAKGLVEFVDAQVNGFFLYTDYRDRARAALAKYRGEA